MGQEDAEDEETAAGDGEQALGRGARAKAKARNEKREKIARRKAKLEKAKAHTKGTPGKATRRDSDGDTAMDGSSDLSEDEADE